MSNWRRDYYRETIQNALEDGPAGGELTAEQVDYLTDAVVGSTEQEGTYSGADCIPDPAIRERADVEARHKREIADLQREIDCYRQSVASRCHANINNVYVDGNGEVIYGKA